MLWLTAACSLLGPEIQATRFSNSSSSQTDTVSETDKVLNNLPWRGYTAKNSVRGKVVQVISGDTIEVEIKGEVITVGYLGVKAPLVDHVVRGTEAFGPEALELNRQTVEGKTVALESDVFTTDGQGRHMRYVFVDDLMVNALLLHKGMAQYSGSPPSIKYAELIFEMQAQAVVNRRGGWREAWRNLIPRR